MFNKPNDEEEEGGMGPRGGVFTVETHCCVETASSSGMDRHINNAPLLYENSI